MALPFETLLVANRGEIACRVARTARRMGLRVVAVHTDADAGARHVREADAAVSLGAAPRAYLDADAVLAAAREAGAGAVHPGYGFLSEDAGFAQAVRDAGLVWVGPEPDVIEAMGNKVRARARMAAAGLPVLAGTEAPLAGPDDAVAAARAIGYPVMVKPAAGGGGIGMAVARDDDGVRAAFETAAARGRQAFGSAEVFLERCVEGGRHVEVQVLGLAPGRVVALGERDCSVQRRHQKLVEETPSPGVGAELRARMTAAAVTATEAVGYTNAGTVECLVAPATQEFFFLEMNTRLQVEHPVTELVTGVDLVEEQLLIAAGLPPSRDLTALAPTGHAVEFRVCAEDPRRFLPSPGAITAWREPAGDGVRVDAGYAAGDTVTPFYDSLLAKLCVWGANREEALDRAERAVAGFGVEGLRTNLPFFAELLARPEFRSGGYDTGLVSRMR